MAARLWNKAPFIRLLAALTGGAVLQWYLQPDVIVSAICFGTSLLLLLFYSFTSIHHRYKLSALSGVSLYFLFAAVGSLFVFLHNVKHQPNWFGHTYKSSNPVLVTLEEPLVEKAASYKAIATVETVFDKGVERKVKGKIILYFKKDSILPPLHYGSQVLLGPSLQEMKNAGNPGSFDYKTYSLFQGITHQVYLTKNDYVLLPTTNKTWIKEAIYNSRSWVISTLRKYIRGEREQGLAEALLIGYKDDLDKALVQAYSNTGVVHIIAISGLHLGLIYWLLLLLTKPLKKVKSLLWLRLLLIVSSLWAFSILAGAGPSVLRSALMFSLIALGEVALRKTTIINTLAFSAFVLLCINPFWLWDVGFQLSYAAVLSIVLFFQPVYHWLHLENKLMDALWKLTAVTIAAQILTLPISIYHFHQMPLLFLLSNFIAVPLSSLVLMGEILLCALFFLPTIAGFVGTILSELISFMNTYVEGLDQLPFSVWNALSINIFQLVLLLIFAITFCYWLLEKQRRYAWIAAGTFSVFMLIRGVSFFEAYNQKKMVIYNVPKHPAIDIINGRSYAFLGDSSLLFEGFERNFHLQPSRVLHRIAPEKKHFSLHSFALGRKQILLLNEALSFASASPKQAIDLLVLSKNPKLYISRLSSAFLIRQVVIDGSVPPWKAALWKKDCDSLHIPCYNVAEEGAFVMNW